MEAVQTHAPFVMRGRARRDDAFGSAMRALGDDATLRKVAPSSIVDVREHSVELRDGGRLYAPSSRSMRVEEALARDPRAVTMGAGGDSLTSRRFDAAEVEASAARPSRNVRRRSRLAPTGGKALARRTTSYERIANASYEKLHELADWRRIGLHEKYADETMVRREATIPTPRRSRRASARRSPIGPAAFPPRRARVAGSVLL